MANELTAILVVIGAAKYYIRYLQSLEIIFRNSRFRLCKYYSKLAFLCHNSEDYVFYLNTLQLNLPFFEFQ